MVKRLGGREQGVQGVRWNLLLVINHLQVTASIGTPKPIDRARISDPYGRSGANLTLKRKMFQRVGALADKALLLYPAS